MRPLALAAALACCAAALAAGSPGEAAAASRGDAGAPARARVLVAFLPARSSPRLTQLDRFAARGMAVGLVSPTLGGYTRRQTVLDVSQGTRISARAYGERVPRVELGLAGRGGRILRWDEALARAQDAPGDVVPGLLADTLRRAGRRVAYLGAPAAEQVEAVVAADRAGRIPRAELAGEPAFGRRLVAAWRASDLLVARLPFGREGLRALDAALAARGERDLVVVLRAPPGLPLKLLPAGVLGGELRGGRLASATTRLDGLVAATDLAPTVLRHMGVAVPASMEGRPIDHLPSGGAEDVRELGVRLQQVVPRRGPVLKAAALALALLLAAGWALRRGAGVRWALRVAFLGAVWTPALALLAAALRPASTLREAALLAGGALVLGALTDRVLPWPRGPALPAAVVFVAYAADLAAGSPLVATSIAGPNPRGGARFYGVGNELEIVLSATVLIGAGTALARSAGPRAARAFAAACLVAGVVIGAGRLGADVGGVITLGAGGAGGVLWLLAAAGRLSRRARIAALAAPAAALALLVAIDVATGGGAHFTRSVLEAEGSGDLLDVAERRWRISFAGLGRVMTGLVVLSAVLLATGVVRRRELLGPAFDAPGLAAGIAATFAATVVGALANDSGPMMLLLGTAALLLAAGYVHGRPRATAPG
jgi:hypothetical protein